jgi:formamidase
LWLPVAVPGALLSIGDTHAAQGDGEVCGTAVETAMTVRVRVNLVKGAGFSNPRYQVTAAAANEPLPKGYYATTGVAPDLLDATKDAIRAMIDHLGKEYSLEPQLAYALCSVAVNLRISEVVDMPNWVVSAVLPRHIFQ